MAPPILLVTGLHPNEQCAPLTADRVYRRLQGLGRSVGLFPVPYSQTVLGLLDEPATAITDYSLPSGGRRLDMDLDGLGDVLRRRFPGSVVFEFHNAEDTSRLFGISPEIPVEDYQIGNVGPDFHRPFQIGTWRNVEPDGRPGKYVIELPAAYVAVSPALLERRLNRLEELQAQGYEFDRTWLPYLERAADVEASRRKGYLRDCLAVKIADWIITRALAE